MLFTGKVAGIGIIPVETVLAASASFHGVKVTVRLEHLGHIALAPVPVTTLNNLVGSCLPEIGLWVSPVAKPSLYILDSHAHVIQGRDVFLLAFPAEEERENPVLRRGARIRICGIHILKPFGKSLLVTAERGTELSDGPFRVNANLFVLLELNRHGSYPLPRF